MRKAAHSPGCARCGAGAGCSAVEYQSLRRGQEDGGAHALAPVRVRLVRGFWEPELRLYIHMGRGQYNLSNTPKLIQDVFIYSSISWLFRTGIVIVYPYSKFRWQIFEHTDSNLGRAHIYIYLYIYIKMNMYIHIYNYKWSDLAPLRSGRRWCWRSCARTNTTASLLSRTEIAIVFPYTTFPV